MDCRVCEIIQGETKSLAIAAANIAHMRIRVDSDAIDGASDFAQK
jgi:hypothetical protein